MPAELELDEEDHITVKKWAADPDGREALTIEANNLGRAAHPGVVELLCFEDDGEHATLRTEFAGDQTWQSTPPATARQLASGIAAVAATLADLHDLAVVHNNLGVDHIIVGRGDRPILCDFRYAGDHDPAIDSAALGHLITHVLESCNDDSPRVRRALTALADRMTDDDPALRPSAAAVALAATAAGSLGSRPSSALLTKPVGVGIASLAVLFALAIVVWDSQEPQALSIPTLEVPPSSVATAAPPPTTQTAPTREPMDAPLIIEFEGFQYAVGSESDRAVVGDWNCDNDLTAAVLRPHMGEIFVFEDWPREGAVSEVTAVAVANAVSDIETSGRCGRIVLIDDDGSRVAIDLESL